MGNTAIAVRGLFVVGFVGALLMSLGCGGGSSGGGGSIPPALSCIDLSLARANFVTMNCGGATNSTTEQVDVVIDGPASGTTTLRGFNFDVIYDATKLEFVPAASYPTPLFDPSALVVVVLFNGQPGRVVVGIQQVGGVPDVVVASGQHLVVSLFFRSVAGATFDPTPLAFDNAAVTDASSSVGFASGLSLGYQP